MVKYYCTWGRPPRDSCPHRPRWWSTSVPEAGLHGIAVLIVPDGELLSLEDQVLGAHLEPAGQRAALPIAHAHLNKKCTLTRNWSILFPLVRSFSVFFLSCSPFSFQISLSKIKRLRVYLFYTVYLRQLFWINLFIRSFFFTNTWAWEMETAVSCNAFITVANFKPHG
jgi:hypothetical protein